MAEQGETYKILPPKDGKRAVIGHRPVVESYFSEVDGTLVEDAWGDVVTASENVDYPRGADQAYRHVRWIEEHPARFKKIKS